MSSRPKLRFQNPGLLTPDTFIESAGLTAGELEEEFTRNFVANLHGKPMQKTVIIYETFIEPLSFIVVDGDLSHLDKVFINNMYSSLELQDELSDLLYDSETGDSTPLLNSAVKDFPVEEVKNGAKVITAGFLP